ncbi:MAG: hypothetical protein ACLT76_03125 [Clostridium fessum]
MDEVDLDSQSLSTYIILSVSAVNIFKKQIPREYLPTLEQFKQVDLSKYTPLSFRDVVDWMKSHSDAYMVLDVKEDAKETYTWIVEHFKENDEMLNHLVVSL